MVGYGRAVALSDVMPWNEFERRCQDAVGATSPLIGSSTAFVPLQVAVKIDPALGTLIRGGASDMELAIGGVAGAAAYVHFGAEQGGIAALAALILKFVISTVKKVKTP